MKTLRCLGLAMLSMVVLMPERASAQPMRQMPGARPFLAVMQNPPNSRVRQAANMVGLESTDFYGKKGYPRVLGDAVEAASTGGNSTGMAGNTGLSGSTGNMGVQSSGSAGFQGNTGNQIGQNGGGTVLGGIFGVVNNTGGNGLGGASSGSITNGGFTGMVPKGFGFGGTPSTETYTPLNGVR